MTAIKNIMNQLYFHSIYYIRMLRKEDFMNYHIVRAGDTFYKLSQMYNVSLETIIRANPEINPNMLIVGQIINIPIGPKEKYPKNTNQNIDSDNSTIGESLSIQNHWSTHKSQSYKVSFDYPSEWEKIMDDYFKGDNGFFVVSTINSDLPLDEVSRKETKQALNPYGDNPSIKEFKIQGQDASLIMPSNDQAKEMDNQAGLIVKYPESAQTNDIESDYAIIWADKNYIERIKDTLEFLE